VKHRLEIVGQELHDRTSHARKGDVGRAFWAVGVDELQLRISQDRRDEVVLLGLFIGNHHTFVDHPVGRHLTSPGRMDAPEEGLCGSTYKGRVLVEHQN
jgi:hypothetical protein